MSKFIILIFLHILGDSVLLSQKMRKLKIEKISYLLKHVGIYMLVFAVFCPLVLEMTITQTIYFVLINGVIHLVIDYFGTKIKQIFWARDDYKYVAVFSIVEHITHIVFLIGIFNYMFPYTIELNRWYHEFLNHLLQ